VSFEIYWPSDSWIGMTGHLLIINSSQLTTGGTKIHGELPC